MRAVIGCAILIATLAAPALRARTVRSDADRACDQNSPGAILLLRRQGSDISDVHRAAVRSQFAHADVVDVFRRCARSRQRVLQEVHFFAFPAGNTGTQMGGWFRNEIKTVEDLKGLKFRIAGMPDRSSAGSGRCRSRSPAVTSIRRCGDIYPALEKGTIDAAEWVGPYDDEKLGFYKVAKFYYYPGWWEGGAMLHNFINLDKWNSLPKSYQEIVRAASDKAHNWMQAKYDAGNPQALKRLVANGAQLRPFPQPVMEAFYKATKDTYDDTVSKNPDFKKVLDSMVAFRGDEYLWWQVAELGFDAFMVRMRANG
jgi:TRAP-type mannitol/chloroaromatic compound transport system substrate-binding protein